MKALVLAGGFPQISLIEKLKERGIITVLADYYENPVARVFADKFYRISTLDVDAIRRLAVREKVDFIITVCTDQALLTVAQVSEDLGLPCYIDYRTARNVTNKTFMKRMLSENNISTAKYTVAESFDEVVASDLKFPLIVKPVDCNSSKGVRRVDNGDELKVAFYDAVKFSRTGTAIVEEYIAGKELSVDVYVENGKAVILDITTSEKLKIRDRFVIFRTWHPADIPETVQFKVKQIAQQIADVFEIKDSPMLIQLLMDGDKVYVVEFSARTGGGVKHLSIERRAGVDVISAVIDLTLQQKPHVVLHEPVSKYMIDEYIYCNPGIYDHMEEFEELKEKGVITDCYVFKWKGAVFDSVENSGDRIGGFTLEGDSIQELQEKHRLVNGAVKIISTDGADIMRHDLIADFDVSEF